MNSRYSAQKPHFGVFLATAIVIFFLSLSAADSIGFVPNYIDGTGPTEVDAATDIASTPNVAETGNLALNELPMLGETPPAKVSTTLPVRIQIPSINLDLKVQNPSTRDIAALDELLKDGPARYVDSAKLGNFGNTIIFAHSSRLPIVHNQMYKAFNKVPELVAGDTISLTGDDSKTYLYAVTEIRKADAAEDTIGLEVGQQTKLTLVTCDTLTGKSARFILSADFVGIVGE